VKNTLLLICIIGCTRWANAQQDVHAILNYMGKVPLQIEAGPYREDNMHDSFLCLLAGGLRVGLMPINGQLVSDHCMHMGKALPTKRWQQLEYSIVLNGKAGPWQPLAPHCYQRSKPLIEMLPFPGDSILLRFRQASNEQAVQSIRFMMSAETPKLCWYRFRDAFDTVDHQLKASTPLTHHKARTYFDTLIGNELTMALGRFPELLFAGPVTNRDSCIEYRIRKGNADTNSNWQLTGHVLALRQLLSGHDYLLDARYKGSLAFSTFKLSMPTPWYKQTALQVLAALLLLRLSYAYYHHRLRKEKLAREEAEQRLKIVQGQLNPHFIFNAMTSIKNLLRKGAAENANAYVDNFSVLLRGTLEGTKHIFGSLQEELEILDSYLQLEQYREGFRYTIQVDQDIIAREVEFPPLLLQPTVENAVKHGMEGMGEKGCIAIQVTRQQDSLCIKVKDNGMGTGATNGLGIGTQVTKQRISHLASIMGRNAIHYNMASTAAGTEVDFVLTKWINT
jgi:two-component sensor histidine kinase